MLNIKAQLDRFKAKNTVFIGWRLSLAAFSEAASKLYVSIELRRKIF